MAKMQIINACVECKDYCERFQNDPPYCFYNKHVCWLDPIMAAYSIAGSCKLLDAPQGEEATK